MRKILIFLTLGFVVFNFAIGREDPLKKRSEEFFFPKITTTGVSQTVINANNITSWLSTISSPGGLGWPPLIRNSYNGTFPRGSGVGVIYREGLMIGGKVSDGGPTTPRAQGIFFRTSLRSGSIITKGRAENFNDPAVSRVWRVRPDYKTADLKADAAEFFMKPLQDVTTADEDAIRQQYENDWKSWPADKGAPWYTTTGPDAYKVRYGPGFDPNNPNHVPGIPGATQTVWAVGNDLDASLGQSVFASIPIGLEVQITKWCYATANPLNNIIFQQFRIIYKGTATTPDNARIDSVYIAKWSDPDLGNYSDDLAGSDSLLSLGYVYNAATIDAEYRAIGLPAPAVGFVFLQGPAQKTGRDQDSAVFGLRWRRGYKYFYDPPMTSFFFFAAGTGISDPTNANMWFNLMRGALPRPEWPSFTPFYSAFKDGFPTKYAVPGDPVTRTGWIDGREIPPGDRRIGIVTGPFSINYGDTVEIVVALVAAMGADNLSSIKVLKYTTLFAIYAYQQLFDLPQPHPAPIVKVSELPNKVVLNWGDPRNLEMENTVIKGFAFEGYNVYQLPSPSASIQEAVKIATFDKINNLTVLFDRVLDPAAGVVVEKPVQVGKDNGIVREIEITYDFIRQRPLVNGQTYYYAVTAYSYNPDPNVPFRVMESPLVVIKTVPQDPLPGVRYSRTYGDTIPVAHTGPAETGGLTVTVSNPQLLTGHNYKVDVVREAGRLKWILTNTTQNRVVYTSYNFGSLLSDDLNDDFYYPSIDGLTLRMSLGYAEMREDSTVWNGAVKWLDGNAFFSEAGQDNHDAAFNDGVLAGHVIDHWFGATRSTIKNRDLKVVEIRFDPARTQLAYRIFRPAAADTGNPGRLYVVMKPPYHPGSPAVSVPFTVWDVTNPASPRQLAVAFVDANRNGVWDIAVTATRRTDYIVIYDLPYNPAMNQFGTDPRGLEPNPTIDAPVMYWCALFIPSGRSLNEAPGVLRIRPQIRVGVGDVYTFRAPDPPSYQTSVASSDVDKINAFPNPYYGFNLMETDRLQKYITFNHLPKKATIKIFNLAGVLVKTINKDDNTQFARWNLRNENNLPVASGIYIVHIDMPEIGKAKILKLLIVQEEEIIPRY